MKLSVIIPVYNEEKTVAKIVKQVLAEKTPKEVIIVDDGSTDQTREIIKKLKDNRIKKLFHAKNSGKGAAIRTGIKNAIGEILLIQDADLEYDPKYYQELLRPIALGQSKVVYGTRLKTLPFRLWGQDKTPFPLHYLVNRFLSALTNLLYGSNLTDMETCYKMISKDIYQKLNLISNRFEIEPEITAKILKMGYSILEVPITTKPRSYQEGKKIKAKDAFIAVWTLFKHRF
jgi:dolichol-phosphate mannosyltransferase